MANTDYYKTLGVSRDATADQIRKAYKKLARENHPDVKPGDKAAAETFKAVQEAYSVLSDPQKREQYDRFGTTFNRGGPGTGGGSYTWSSTSGGMPPDLEELFGGAGGGGFNFSDLFGSGFRRGAGGRTRTQAPAKGRDVAMEMTVPFQTAAEGGRHELQLNRGGQIERLDVTIPAGIADGQVIRLAGQGEGSPLGGPAGDLRLTIRIAPHPYFRRDGSNLVVDAPITVSEAALGAKIEVPTLTEGKVMVTIPPGTSSGTKLRLRGKGVPNQKTKQRGDQFVVVKVVVPKDLNQRAKQLFEELSEIAPQSPRSTLW